MAAYWNVFIYDSTHAKNDWRENPWEMILPLRRLADVSGLDHSLHNPNSEAANEPGMAPDDRRELLGEAVMLM